VSSSGQFGAFADLLHGELETEGALSIKRGRRVFSRQGNHEITWELYVVHFSSLSSKAASALSTLFIFRELAIQVSYHKLCTIVMIMNSAKAKGPTGQATADSL
jgi:hypothetical protein